MTVTVRFAPSPTGFLHIGGARTALFNWLFARHHGGRFLLRIEDTDRQRSTQAAIDAIIDGLKWLGLDWDGDIVFQFVRSARHAEVARRLLAEGKAYCCYASPEELEQMRAEQKARGLPLRYDGRWRDRDPREAPPNVKPVIRLKAPRTGETVVEDRVQGRITVANEQLDDMVLLRADGTPTYMHSVVVDDIDMGITHVIRGSDHMTNTFRQVQLYRAIGAEPPQFAHIPLIHGADGAKLSKRHGALGVEAYRDMGYLPEAMRNYLLRLGWAHGDDEIIPTDQAVEWFDLGGVGQSPARFDFAKLDSVNAHYMREAPDARLAALMRPFLEKKRGKPIDPHGFARVLRGMPGLKPRAQTLVQLADIAAFYVADRPLPMDDKAQKLLTPEAKAMLGRLRSRLAGVTPWHEVAIEEAVRGFAEAEKLGLGKVAQPLRAALTGTTASPGIFEVMAVLGSEESLGRIADQAGG
ncbi:MAG: glutamate--tRNA ligase [Alphaproteobacteria bacterium]|nr:glutamate--tRNA ligase [Alphaproteobacteria bacterium]